MTPSAMTRPWEMSAPASATPGSVNVDDASVRAKTATHVIVMNRKNVVAVQRGHKPTWRWGASFAFGMYSISGLRGPKTPLS